MHESSLAELRQINDNIICEMSVLKGSTIQHAHALVSRSDVLTNISDVVRDDVNFPGKHSFKARTWDNHFEGKSKTWMDDPQNIKQLNNSCEDLVACEIKRRRFGALRRTVSTSSLPSEHDETPTSSPPPEKYDVGESSVDSLEEFNNCSSNLQPPASASKERMNSRNAAYLTVPDITITDTMTFKNMDNYMPSVKIK